MLLKRLELELSIRQSYRKLTDYVPYEKQKAFHNAGSKYRERLFLAGNRCGKTQAGAFEMAMHLTGLYPDWWEGKRFSKPVRAWAAGVTGESTRDVVQEKLFGPPNQREAWGSGAIPKDTIGDIATARGIANAIDMASIRHVSGGWSSLAFKTYEKGREKWQGAALEVIWMDEEGPRDVYSEALTRTNETGGVVYMTCTPLLGMSDVMKTFLMDGSPNRNVTQAGIEDAGHFTAEDRARMMLQYPAHEREARLKGIPQLGSGRVFPIDEDEIKVPSFKIPDHWPQIGGIDFGWDHPSAGVKLAWDRDADCVYVIAAHRQREQTPAMFGAAVKPWGANPDGSQWLPWAWPHDGLQHDKGSGEQLAAQYRAYIRMLPMRATFEDGSFGVEAGIAQMFDRMQTGRFKVFGHLEDWFEEFRLYHRKDGLIVKKGDDLLSATRYGCMMLRHAIVKAKQAPTQAQRQPMGRGAGWMG